MSGPIQKLQAKASALQDCLGAMKAAADLLESGGDPAVVAEHLRQVATKHIVAFGVRVRT